MPGSEWIALMDYFNFSGTLCQLYFIEEWLRMWTLTHIHRLHGSYPCSASYIIRQLILTFASHGFSYENEDNNSSHVMGFWILGERTHVKSFNYACLAHGKILNKSWLLIPLYNLRQVTSSLSSYFLILEMELIIPTSELLWRSNGISYL